MFMRLVLIGGKPTPIHHGCGGGFKWVPDHKIGEKSVGLCLVCENCHHFTKFVREGSLTGITWGLMGEFFSPTGEKLGGNGS